MGTGRMVKDKQDRQSHYPWMIYIWFIYSLIHLFVNFTCLTNLLNIIWKQLRHILSCRHEKNIHLLK